MKYVFKIVYSRIITLLGCMAMFLSYTQADLLQNVYREAWTNDYIVKIGNTDNARLAGKEALVGFGNKDSLLVRLTKWLLELTVIIGVPLLIFGGIKYIIAVGDEGAQKSARSWIINVVIGIVLALSSLAIVTFISSLLNDQRLGQNYDQTTPKAPQ